MSNKRNRRRLGQLVRHEKSRKPVVITKAMSAFIDSQAAERERKERERYWKRPTKAERIEWRKYRARSRWARLGLAKVPGWKRKPRTNHGATFWRHSLDV